MALLLILIILLIAAALARHAKPGGEGGVEMTTVVGAIFPRAGQNQDNALQPLLGAWIMDLQTGRPALATAWPAPTQLLQEDTWLSMDAHTFSPYFLVVPPIALIMVFIHRKELDDTNLTFPP